MRILLIDDHFMIRVALKFLLDSIDTNVEFAEAGDLGELHIVANPETIDLVLLDYRLEDVQSFDGLSLVLTLFKNAYVVMLSAEEDPKVIQQAINAGAAGYITKKQSDQLLIPALKVVMAGGKYVPASSLAISASPASELALVHQPDAVQNLSPRQKEVLRRMASGKANKVIARELDITDHTVKAHLGVAFRVLGVQNRTQAASVAMKLGIV